MRKIQFGHIAIIFGVCGIALLYVVTVLSQPLHIDDYSDLAEHEGEIVSVEGTVINFYLTNTGELFYTFYKDTDLLDVVIENDINVNKIAKINSIVSVTGEVQKNYQGEYELVVTDSKNIEVVGYYEAPLLEWTNLESCNNTYIQARGTIIGLEDYYGGKQKLTFKNNTNQIPVILSDPSSINLGIGDNIELSGIVRNTYAGYSIYIYSTETITITGHFQLQSVGLVDLTNEPEKYMDFPTNVQGVVRYEPWVNPANSFYLGDNNENPQINIRVDLSEYDSGGKEFHKGDTVALVAYSAFDKSQVRYYLTPIALEVTARYGEWNVSLEELAESTFEYENALLNLSAYIHYINEDIYLCDRAVFENSSIVLPMQFNDYKSSLSGTSLLNVTAGQTGNSTTCGHKYPSGEKVAVRGTLFYSSERFIYQFAPEPNPNCIFLFPHFE